MSKSRDHSLSRFLSYVLRHKPDAIGLSLDARGWVSVDALLAAMAAHGRTATFDELAHVVATNEKKRFALNGDRTKIRASQGHSVRVELAYSPQRPPGSLYHGTVERFLDGIRSQGLTRQRRHHVHLSGDAETAATVGARRGTPVVLKIDAGGMHAGGHVFYLSENGVWLTERVPPAFIAFP